MHATFEKFLEVLKTDLEAVEKKIASANSSFSSDISQSQKTEPGDNVQPESQSSSLSDKSDEKHLKNKELTERRTEYGIAWVSYMRFARRAEGLKPSRAIFGKARKERWTPWEVYEAAGKPRPACFSPITDTSALSIDGVPLQQGCRRSEPYLREGYGHIP